MVGVLPLGALSFFSRAPSFSPPWALYLLCIRAVVKTAEPDKWKLHKNEFDVYQKPNIRRSRFIRAFYDHINEYKDPDNYPDNDSFNAAAAAEPFSLVLEYMDVPLAKVDAEDNKRKLEFMKALFEAHLEGTWDMYKDGLIWTGT